MADGCCDEMSLLTCEAGQLEALSVCKFMEFNQTSWLETCGSQSLCSTLLPCRSRDAENPEIFLFFPMF